MHSSRQTFLIGLIGADIQGSLAACLHGCVIASPSNPTRSALVEKPLAHSAALDCRPLFQQTQILAGAGCDEQRPVLIVTVREQLFAAINDETWRDAHKKYRQFLRTHRHDCHNGTIVELTA